jgi:hypothetical protein
MTKLMSKSELIQKIAEQHSKNMARKDVEAVIEALATIGYKELNKSGAFPDLQNSSLSRSRRQRSGAASIHSQKSQQYLRQSRLGRSPELDR